MKFGLICEFRNPEQWQRPISAVYDDILEHLCAAENLGFDAVEILEHHFVDDGYIPSPLVALSAIAVKTKKMRLATNVALLPLYDPVRFAEDTAVVDAISHGRLDVGVSIGYRPTEFSGYSVDIKTRGARMDESVQILRRLWSGESVSFAGKFYNFKNVKVSPRPVQRPNPPLWIGGFTPPAVRRAAKYGDGYTGLWNDATSKQTYDLYLQELRAAGKDPAAARIRLCTSFFVVSHEPEKTFNAFAPHVVYWANSYASWFEESGTKLWAPLADAEALRASGLLVVLTPDQAIQRLKHIAATVPILDTFSMLLTPPGIPAEKSFKHIELFAKEVMPAFR